MKTVLLFIGLSASSVLTAQVTPPDSDGNQPTPAPQPVPPYQRPVSLGRIIPNIVDDQSKIWLFPAKLNKKRNWIPAAAILGTTAALIALDSHDAPYFRSDFNFRRLQQRLHRQCHRDRHGHRPGVALRNGSDLER